jgi:hypothetical protein
MADINDRLDRLHRREEFDRNGLPLRADPVGAPVARPAGVDDRLGEVLDAVAAVVRRHTGLSVMVAIADGKAGRPVVRVTERDGSVETGVVVVGAGAPTPADQAAVVPSTERPRESVPPEVAYEPVYAPVREPAYEPPVEESDGRHAARSWHDSLWSAGAQARFRAAEEARAEELPAPPGGTIPLPQDTSQVVSRLAQLLRDNPTLASSWSREAPE